MPLVQSTLQTKIKAILDLGDISMGAHYIALANAYDDYAKLGIESVASNPIAVTGKSAFQSTMSGYDAVPKTLPTYATFLENACRAYWTPPNSIFSLSLRPSGWNSLLSIAITPMASGSIQPGVSSALLASTGNTTVLSSAIASILHSATLTVSVLLSGTTPPTVPVTATGTVT